MIGQIPFPCRAAIAALILTMSLLCAATAEAQSAIDQGMRSKVAELNRRSVELFGVSLYALDYLRNTQSSYLHLGMLERSGEIKFIRELERKGYAKTTTVKALPDGTQQHETFLQVIATNDGIALRQALLDASIGANAK